MPAELPQPEDYGLWRFGIISPLLHRTEGDPPLHKRIKDLAQQVFYTPHGMEKHIHPDTIRGWVEDYRIHGIDGLCKKQRKDRGATSVPQNLQEALSTVRAQHPKWTVKRLLRTLRAQGDWDGCKPSRSAMYRFTSAHGLNRSAKQPPLPVRSFEYPYFGDLWSADFLHGPKVRRGTHAYKSYLHAIIDDATRYVVVARFHLAEDTHSLLDDLMLAIRRFGIPKRLYTDNGAAFRSRHLRLVAAKLGISLPHTPPYKPRGRGKVERFFRSVREGFLTGREPSILDKLNAEFAVWISQYHQTQHRGLGMSPLDRKLTDTGPQLTQIAPTQDIDEIFRIELRKRVGSDGCVRMFQKRFEIPDAIPGTSVVFTYLPWNQDCIFYGPDKRTLKPLNTINNALRFDKPRRGDKQEEKQ
jgi:putative transposase